jgi:hypothetical protein
MYLGCESGVVTSGIHEGMLVLAAAVCISSSMFQVLVAGCERPSAAAKPATPWLYLCLRMLSCLEAMAQAATYLQG